MLTINILIYKRIIIDHYHYYHYSTYLVWLALVLGSCSILVHKILKMYVLILELKKKKLL